MIFVTPKYSRILNRFGCCGVDRVIHFNNSKCHTETPWFKISCKILKKAWLKVMSHFRIVNTTTWKFGLT